MVPPRFTAALWPRHRRVQERASSKLTRTPILQPRITVADSGSVYLRPARSTGYSGVSFHVPRQHRIPAARLSLVTVRSCTRPFRASLCVLLTLGNTTECVKSNHTVSSTRSRSAHAIAASQSSRTAAASWGPGAPSGWNWTERMGRERWANPSTVPSCRLRWETRSSGGREDASTA